MAYKWNPHGQFYIGLVDDIKPTSVDRGVLLYEINLETGVRKTYQTHDGTIWTEISNDSLGTVSLEAGSNIIGQVQLSGSNLKGANVITVTTAGTRVQLPTLACNKVTIIAKRVNTGYIYVGMSTVSPSVYGVELAAKDSMDFEVNNLNEIWIDASVSGEGISYVAL